MYQGNPTIGRAAIHYCQDSRTSDGVSSDQGGLFCNDFGIAADLGFTHSCRILDSGDA